METKYDNSGALFVNDRKEKDTHADRQGSATIDGVEYWVNGWLKEGKKGKFLSLAFKRKEESAARDKPKGKVDDDFESDIPF